MKEKEFKGKILKSEIINDIGRELNEYNEAQWINTIEYTTRYGKVYNKVYGNTRAGLIISQLPDKNFGSIGDYNINTLPSSYMRVKGIEKYELNTDGLYYKGMQVISRRFLSNILSTWCYIIGMPYKYGIKMWCSEETQLAYHKEYKKEETDRGVRYKLVEDKPKYKTYKMISGLEGIQMIKDILYLMRNKTPEKLMKNAEKGIISSQLHSVIFTLFNDKIYSKKERLEHFNRIKDRLYYIFNEYGIAWSFPKYNPNYLISIIKELQSGHYATDLYVPIIHNLKKYPIKCTDTHIKPLTDEEHQKNKDDYDLTKYIVEEY